MGGTAETTAFALTRLEQHDGELVVEGRWSGVRGLRFLRPTLLVGDRPVLASLAEKPWPAEAERWRATFPWDGSTPEVRDLVLVVAPSVAVRLDDGTPAAPPSRAVAPPPPAAAAVTPPPVVPPEDRFADERAALRAERDALRAAVARLEATLARAGDDERRARIRAERDAEHARADAEQARREREAAVRARDRLAREHEEAVAEAQQRTDEAERVPAEREEPLRAEEAPRRETPGSDEPPAGVRVVRTARHADPAPRAAPDRLDRHLSAFDVWTIRVVGSVAAACFLALLVLLAFALA